MPKAFPRSFAGKTEVRIAILVANIMEAPIPWNKRPHISIQPEFEAPQHIVEAMKIIMPEIKIFLRPIRSASLLKGMGNMAEVSRKIEITQLREIALSENSLAIIGMARFKADPMNGITVVARQMIKSIVLR